jgi:hypothetical protein
MQDRDDFGSGAGLRPGWIVAAAVLAAGLAGCGGGAGIGMAETPLGQFFRGTTAEPAGIDPALVAAPLPCPQVRIEQGSEALRREDSERGAQGLRWQASISRTARECREIEAVEGEGGPVLAVRVGVSGRVIEGARGAPDIVELPLRVAVREGGDVTYSRVHSVRVAVESGSQAWAFVDEDVRIAAPEGAVIVVGFDT